MTKGFAAKAIGLAGAVVLASILATSVGAQSPLRVSQLASPKPETMALFFDMQSATLTREAKTIVLSAVDTAKRTHSRYIELAAYASPAEAARDPKLIERRAVAVKRQIANYGFRGVVVMDEATPELVLATMGDEPLDRRVTLHLGG